MFTAFAMIRRQHWIGLGALLFAAFAVLNLLAYSHAHAMMHFTPGGPRTASPEELSWADKVRLLAAGVNMPRAMAARPPVELGPECRTLAIDGGTGVVLEAWYGDQGPETPLVVLFHGYTADKSALLQEARAFAALGASVLLVDFRGAGGSSESYTTIGYLEADDVAAAYEYARARLPHAAVVLFGQSMGAAAILRAVHEHGLAPDAVILEAVFDTMLNTVRHRFDAMHVPSFPGAQLLVFWGGRQWGFNAFAHNPVDYARSLACPSLFMHGGHDPRATLAEGRRVFAAVAGPKWFTEFSSAGHEGYLAKDPARWRSSVADLLGRL